MFSTLYGCYEPTVNIVTMLGLLGSSRMLAIQVQNIKSRIMHVEIAILL